MPLAISAHIASRPSVTSRTYASHGTLLGSAARDGTGPPWRPRPHARPPYLRAQLWDDSILRIRTMRLPRRQNRDASENLVRQPGYFSDNCELLLGSAAMTAVEPVTAVLSGKPAGDVHARAPSNLTRIRGRLLVFSKCEKPDLAPIQHIEFVSPVESIPHAATASKGALAISHPMAMKSFG